MRIILLFILFLSIEYSYAQEYSIAGALKTKDGEAVSFASILIKDPENKVLVFKTSDSNGAFTLTIPKTTEANKLVLEINHLGYKKIHQDIKEGILDYEILMEKQAIDLSEVEIKSKPIIRSIGDTLSYNIDSFAKNEDRSINDVIKRLPGMEVNENGKIKFNGQDISNLYIDGDDLLDEKYALGTKTIPYNMVKDLEVLQNHQPLKVLRNKTLSDKVAINLVIKEEAKLKLSGQAKLGLGLPKQYDGELNSILFNKKYKMLNILKGNNIGKDLSSDSQPAGLLSSGTVGNPGLAKNRYYFNNSVSANANNLINYKNGLQLKVGINMLLDKNEMKYNSITNLYSTNDTIQYSEEQNINNHPFLTDINLNAQFNKEKYYFNNTLKLIYSKETSSSSLLSNEANMNQRLKNQVQSFSNELEYVPEFKNKNILHFNWHLSYSNQPQTLSIRPGINAAIFNEGIPFEAINQFAETPTLDNRVSIAYQLTKGRIKQSYQAGIVNEFQNLNSQLRFKQFDGSETSYQSDHDNDLNWNRNQFFVNGSYEYKKGALESVFSVPVILQRISYDDKSFNLDKSETQLLITPTLRIKYLTGSENYLSFNYKFSNETGNINNVFRGAILSNYRSLQANDADLQKQYKHNLNLDYNFRRSINMLFMNAGVNYVTTKSTTITSNIISNNISQTILLPLINHVNSFNIHGGISKYIFSLGATADLKASWGYTHFNQLFNNDLLPFNNISFMLNPSLEARLINRISINYSSIATWTTSKSETKNNIAILPDRQIQNLDQSIGLTYAPYKNTFLRVSGRHQLTKQPGTKNVNYFFADVNASYKIAKWRTDIELNLTNLANITSYETQSISANSSVYSSYQLRGRMAVLKFIFNL
ncbi:peptidase associated/transthyretin-like domain-containing protein [Albibacterium bauzanense]|uniref:Carboxypeptidase-like protein n=1 Tax=Albibacterium bauzanense TaxID=653929 RepID=A0A4R1LNI6_9SPHI|nr:hypothetical protein [Albibacterium bauzanense]TCK80596.1 hypothetical protein C8N28_2338 [Albibacterium bauzanense]